MSDRAATSGGRYNIRPSRADHKLLHLSEFLATSHLAMRSRSRTADTTELDASPQSNVPSIPVALVECGHEVIELRATVFDAGQFAGHAAT